MRSKSTAICLRPDCGQRVEARGLCGTDYRVARDLVRAGKTTWERLVELGRAKPTGQRAVTNPARDWLLADPTLEE